MRFHRPRPLSTRPTVSVVVPCYRYGHFLPAAVASVLDQDGVDVDVIVVDDASTDGSADVARGLAAADGRVRVLVAHDERGPHRDVQRRARPGRRATTSSCCRPTTCSSPGRWHVRSLCSSTSPASAWSTGTRCRSPTPCPETSISSRAAGRRGRGDDWLALDVPTWRSNPVYTPEVVHAPRGAGQRSARTTPACPPAPTCCSGTAPRPVGTSAGSTTRPGPLPGARRQHARHPVPRRACRPPRAAGGRAGAVRRAACRQPPARVRYGWPPTAPSRAGRRGSPWPRCATPGTTQRRRPTVRSPTRRSPASAGAPPRAGSAVPMLWLEARSAGLVRRIERHLEWRLWRRYGT